MPRSQNGPSSRRVERRPGQGPVAITSIYKIDKLIDLKRARTQGLTDDEEELQQLARSKVPKEYQDLLHVFSKKESDRLARRTHLDHHIDLLPSVNLEELGYSALYKISLEELEAYRKYIIENLAKGFIIPSDTP